MSNWLSAIHDAFSRLEARAGFEARPAQHEMSAFIAECLSTGQTACIEAPTGVGKSLGALIPLIAWTLATGKRVVVSTYTNVLAEQYWRKDLPLALELFGEAGSELKTQLVMGRSRYACIDRIYGREGTHLEPALLRFLKEWVPLAQEGVESELAPFLRRKGVPEGLTRDLWRQIATPPACRARTCPHYASCFYYRQRRAAANAQLIITNHSVVLTDALLKASGAEGLLDEYDWLLVDEAHDLPEAACSALEFELSPETLEEMIRNASSLSHQIANALEGEQRPDALLHTIAELVQVLSRGCHAAVAPLNMADIPSEGRIVAIAPKIFLSDPDGYPGKENFPELMEDESVQKASRTDWLPVLQAVVENLQSELRRFYSEIKRELKHHRAQMTDRQYEAVREAVNQYASWFRNLYTGLNLLVNPVEGVSWVEAAPMGWRACYQPLEVGAWLAEHLWSRQPATLMSATLTIDGTFDFFLRQVGLSEGVRTLCLPPVFDYARQCALYLPPRGVLPPPPRSARSHDAPAYYRAVAEQLMQILQATRGRALVLFTSRAEMEAVRDALPPMPSLRLMMQGDSANADLSQRFREDTESVLFGLRSFWTGFDAPGETLSCVVLVRIPFEVPVSPPQVARHALLRWRGEDPFESWTLPRAKQQVRQGFGRLIRRADDRGIICLLDARFHTRPYGKQILANLPPNIPIYHRIEDAIQVLNNPLSP
ncbi:putative ATP-dependent helicase DinG [bacterium HR15]|nr:putative ATP-dependent helicase DinG [bacterium HR15]